MNAVSFLYEDASLVVVDKPAGVTVVPAPGLPPASCLRDRTAAALGTRVWVVHPLDRDTSGVVVFARTAEAHRALAAAFAARAIDTRFTALVCGRPTPLEGVIEVPLHAARRGKSRPAVAGEPDARDASTAYAVTRLWQHEARHLAAVTVLPRTGHHHQIRVHLRAAGAPIAGDGLYGSAATRAISDVPVPRLALHAASIEVPHPSGDRRVSAAAPWPADLEAVTAWLDQHWHQESLS